MALKSEKFDIEQSGPNSVSNKLLNIKSSMHVLTIVIVCAIVSIGIGFASGFVFKSNMISEKTVYVYSTSATSKEPKENLTTYLPPDSTGIWNDPRLPTYLIPSRYTLIIRSVFRPSISVYELSKPLDFDTSSDGDIEIDLKITKSTNEIMLHADDTLEILEPIRILNLDSNNEIQVRDEMHTHKPNQYYYIKLEKYIPAGNYRIIMGFQTTVKSLFGNAGVFATSYEEDDMIK
jgi:hypothetical protein